MNGIMEKIGRRKVVIVILLVGIVAFSIGYALIQTKTGLAVLTTPPPGIPGPYYVTAEAKIYGPVVDLAEIRSKTGGNYSVDYTYVQWGTNPLYRAYVDNTIQEIYWGQMMDVIDRFSPWEGYPQETSLIDTVDYLVNVGAIDAISVFGVIRYFGNLPGTIIGMNPSGTYNLTTWADSWRAVVIHARSGYSSYQDPYNWIYWHHYHHSSSVIVNLNESSIMNYSSPGGYWITPGGTSQGDTLDHRLMNATGYSNGLEFYNFTINVAKGAYGGDAAVALYLGNATHIETSMETSSYRTYQVIDSPGTGFVSKYVSPPSPVIGSTIEVIVILDPPAARKMNITDLYPNTFTWSGGQVTLRKFRIGVGLVATASVGVTPNPVGSNMQFTVYYNQATNVLESLLSDEYVYMSYTLTAPSTAGEYTLSAATMSYSIPLPQT